VTFTDRGSPGFLQVCLPIQGKVKSSMYVPTGNIVHCVYDALVGKSLACDAANLILYTSMLQTAIAEGLARAIVERKLPDGSPLPKFLHDKRIVQLDVALLIAGAKERGELESRIRNLLTEVANSGNVILM
jgi:hypothetical protein